MGQIVPCKFQAFATDGDLLSGGKVHTYEAETDTPKTTYSDSALNSANANPVVLDSRGEALIYGTGTYKIVLMDSEDVTLWTVDNVELLAVTYLADGDNDTKIQVEESEDEDIIRFDIAGTEQVTLQDGKFEPTTDNDVDLGSSTKKFKNGYFDGVLFADEFDIDGTYKAVFPSNGVAGDAVIMLGNSSTIGWWYLNAAPPGWKVLATGADSVLGVKATARSSGTADGNTPSKLIDSGADFVTDSVVVGDVAYNLTDGTSALVTAIDDLNTLALASDVFPDGDEEYEVGTAFIDPGGTQADEGTWTGAAHTLLDAEIPKHIHPAGSLTIDTGTGSDSQTHMTPPASSYTGNADSAHISGDTGEQATGDGSHAHGNITRPVASIGRLFQLDTAA